MFDSCGCEYFGVFRCVAVSGGLMCSCVDSFYLFYVIGMVLGFVEAFCICNVDCIGVRRGVVYLLGFEDFFRIVLV